MDKQAYLEETYNAAFNDELEKVSLSIKTYRNALKKVDPEMYNKSKELGWDLLNNKSSLRTVLKGSFDLKHVNERFKKRIKEMTRPRK